MVSFIPVKQLRLKPKRRRRRSQILPYILGSVIFHLLLLLLFIVYQFDFIDRHAKEEKKQPEYIEITELPVPKEKETKPPEKPKRLAERSHTAPEEKTRDEYTKRSITTPPLPEPVPRQQPKPETRKQETKKTEKKVEKKPEAKVARESSKEKARQQIKREDLLRKEALASLPKEQLKKETEKSTRAVERPQTRETPNLTKEELFSNVPTTFPQSRQTAPDYLGARDVNKKEDTVELSTTEFKYISYFAKLKRQIEAVWNYPQESRYRGEEGQLFLVFTIRSNGDLENIELLNSSGYARLDNEAMRAIRVAAPYAPFPKDWGALEKLHIKATFIYQFGGFIR